MQCYENVPLWYYSNYKIGGLARYFATPKTISNLIDILDFARKLQISVFILGGGTNILFDDRGFNGLVIKPDFQFIKKNDDRTIRVGGGVLINKLVGYYIDKSFTGLEWAGGLPGSLGGAIYGNAGCFGGEMKDIVEEVISLDITKKKYKIIKRSNKECRFSYRSSIFKKNKGREIILEAVLRFQKGKRSLIKSAVEEKINYRMTRQPLEYPNIGSIFKNVNFKNISPENRSQFFSVVKVDPFPVVPAAYLIHLAGLKGVSCGGALVSPKHPNFIVNVLEATACDVKNLIFLVKHKVKNKFNITLEEEIEYLAN
jgi:UDP-N-acetylmuramate dehydrogenase